MSLTRFDPVNYPRVPLTNVSPFTYRDGRTFLEVLEGLRDYITNTIVPGVNANFDLIVQNYLDALTQMEANYLDARTQMEADKNAAVAAIQAIYDAFMVDVSASLRVLTDPEIAALINIPTSDTANALESKFVEMLMSDTANVLESKFVRKTSLVRNILDYDVETGTAESQTATIKAALDANPGATFYFPPGDYRLDTQLLVDADNSLILESGARLYAGATIDGALVLYDNGSTGASGYAQDRGIFGAGIIDADLKAAKCLEVASVIRFTISGITLVDGINRGLHTRSKGAEVIVSNVRIHNTGTANAAKSLSVVTTNGSTTITNATGSFTASDVGSPVFANGVPDGAYIGTYIDSSSATLSAGATATANVIASIVTNVGIEAHMSDCHFSDVIIRDCTIGVWNRGGSNVYARVHPWLGAADQLAVRFAHSVGFKFTGGSAVLIAPYADTYRYSFQSDGVGNVRLLAPKAYCNTGNLSSALAIAYPGAIFDLGDTGALIFAEQGQFSGHSAIVYPLFIGNYRRFFHRNGFNLGQVDGLADYKWGVRLGTRPITVTLEGSTASGGNTYTSVSGSMEVRDGVVFYRFYMTVTIGSGTTGNLRIVLPYPVGAASTSPGVGNISFSTGVDATGMIGGNASPSGPPWDAGMVQTLVVKAGGGVSPEVAVPAAGTVVQLWGEMSLPFTYPN